MKKIRTLLGLTAGALLAVGVTGCDTSDSDDGGGGNSGAGSGTKASIHEQETPAAEPRAGGSDTKPSEPSDGSGSKTNAPTDGSATKSSSPPDGSWSKE